jgi:biopolymer transport protein ExbD
MAALFGDVDGVPRKKPEEAELDITPMIDVTFLLLIFFMVTSTMQSQSELNIPVAKHGTGVPGATVTIVKIRSGDPPVIMRKNGSEMSLDEVTAYVQEGFPEKDEVVIKADRDVPHGFVQEVTREVVKVEDIKFSIGVKEKP